MFNITHHLSRIRTRPLNFTIRRFSDKQGPEAATQTVTDPYSLLPEDERKDFFKLNELFSMENLFEARCHFGHKDVLLNQHMRPYIFGKRLGVTIIDLNETTRLLRRALLISAEIAYRKGIILFVMENRQNAHFVEDAAKDCGEYAYCRKWNDRIFTDSQAIFNAVTRLPDLCIFFSTLGAFGHHRGITISAKMLIPTIAICDTNSDPTLVTYPVPGNDDTPDSIQLYSRLFKEAIMKGKEKREDILERYGEEFYYKTID